MVVLRWYPKNPKWSFLVEKNKVVGYHQFRNPPRYLFISIQSIQVLSGIKKVTFCWGHPTLRGGTRRGGAEHLQFGGLGGYQPLSCGQSYRSEAAGLCMVKVMKNWQIRWSDAPFWMLRTIQKTLPGLLSSSRIYVLSAWKDRSEVLSLFNPSDGTFEKAMMGLIID